jgi:simple sugar transport system permease protein
MTTVTSTVPRRQRTRITVSGILAALAPVVLALVVGGVVIRATGDDPLAVYRLLLREALGGTDRVAATLTSATPLLFTGLATTVAFRAGVFTLGVEGSFVLGGLAAAIVGAAGGGLPGPAAIVVCLLAATAAGCLVGLIPAVLKARWAVDEVVTTLMLNFVAIGLSGWLVRSFLQAKGQANSATALISANADLPRLLPPSQLNLGLIIALLLVTLYALWINRSVRGYEFRMVGTNPRFAAAQGIDVPRVVGLALVAAGAVGGLGGGVHTLGIVHRFVGGFSPGFGFTGIAIALLARFDPAGVVIVAVGFGALASAGSTVQLFTGIPLNIVDVLQGTVMVFAVARFTVPRLRRRLPGLDRRA